MDFEFEDLKYFGDKSDIFLVDLETFGVDFSLMLYFYSITDKSGL